MQIINQIIDRDCNVSLSNRRVIRRVIACLREGYKTFTEMPREDRRAFMRACIKRHTENRQEYNFVMRG